MNVVVLVLFPHDWNNENTSDTSSSGELCHFKAVQKSESKVKQAQILIAPVLHVYSIVVCDQNRSIVFVKHNGLHGG